MKRSEGSAVLAGKDNFCMNHLKAFRAGMFDL